MKPMFIMRSSAILLLVMAVMALSFSSKNKLSIDGTWSVAEVQTVKSDGTFMSTFPKESEVIFSHPYYSFDWTSHVSTLRSWSMPDSTKLIRFNQSIINAGTYELADSILATKATFALNPMFVNGLAKFKCSFIGDTLVLTGLSLISADLIPHPIYAGGSHIVNKLIKIRDK